MKRFIAIMLALLLCAAINPALALPTPDYDSSMSFSFALGANGDSTSVTVAPGDILTLKVSAARVDDTASAFQMYALMTETVYNSAYFELVQDSAQMTEITAHTAVAVSPVKLGEETVMKLSYDTNSAAGSQVQPSFTVGTFQFKVKALPTGSAGAATSIKLRNCYFCTEDGMKRYVTADEGSVAVSIGVPSSGSYNITVTQPTDGGTITAPASAKAGETVTLSVSLDDGYTVNSWYVIGATDLKTANTERTTAVFTMPSRDVTVSISLNAPTGGGSGGGGGGGGSAVGPAAQPSIDITDESTPLSGASFTDVAPGHWAYQFVEYLALRGYINGKSETEFMPNALITRAEFITILARMSGETLPETYTGAFTDIKQGSYYEGAVAWGVKNGITNGVTETTFNPNDNITRQQIAAMLSRYAEYKQYTLARQIDAPDFIDNADIADYAKNPVREMQGAGIIGGYEDGAFRPKNNATRAEAAKMLGVLHYLMDN